MAAATRRVAIENSNMAFEFVDFFKLLVLICADWPVPYHVVVPFIENRASSFTSDISRRAIHAHWNNNHIVLLSRVSAVYSCDRVEFLV